MILIIARIIAIIIGITAIAKTYYDFKKHDENITMFLFWLITWCAVIAGALFPMIVIRLTNNIGQKGAGIGTLFGLIIIFILFISYRIYLKSGRTERQIHDIVMKLGLRDIDKK